MRVVFLFLLSQWLTLSVLAQERVRNVRIRVIDSTTLDIRYDLVATRTGDSIYLQMRSRLRGAIQISPEFLRGDLGVGITAGSDRHIYWDALANGYSLNEEVQAKIVVKAGTVARQKPPVEQEPVVAEAPQLAEPPKAESAKPKESVAVTAPQPVQPAQPIPAATPPTSSPKVERPPVVLADTAVVSAPANAVVTSPKPPPSATVSPESSTVGQPNSVQPEDVSARSVRRRYAGPDWALLSILAPGVGNIFVQTPKPKIGLRPLIALACYGAVAYGFTERQKALDQYAIYEQQKNVTQAEPYYQAANQQYHRYFLATRGAILVAAADVVLTFVRGLRNNRLQREASRLQGVRVRPGLQAGQPTAVLHYSF